MKPALACIPLLLMALVSSTFAAPALAADTTPANLAGQQSAAFLQECRQMLLVLSPDWASVEGRLQRFERQPGGAWRAVGEAVPADLGKNGMGWGLGLHPHEAGLAGDPTKAEGDGRVPAGAFALPLAFAYDPAELPGAAMRVLDIGPETFCVDDSASAQYNSLVELPAGATAAWTSSEAMLRPDGYYRLGLLVAHNLNPPTPGAGSCIFMHIEHSDGSPTVGCTVLNAERLREVLLWLDPMQRPALVQLPQPAYDRLRQEWGLP